MVNKILIRTSDRKTLHKDRRSLGMNGENLQEVLLFCLDERIEGTGIVEVELPDGEKGMIEVERTEEGYELPVKSSLLTQTSFVKFQLRILHDNEEIFKSEIIPLEVKDSINATETIPEQYPTWIDNLTTLKQELEKAESERASNENERISAEKTRQENFTEMQKTVENATSNIKDLKEDYNENAKQKTEEFNKNFEEKQKAINDNAEAKTTAFGENAEAQTKTFNTNSDDKLAEYNKNHTAKMKEFDDNYDTKTKTFDDNAAAKLDKYNKNTELKEKSFNDNAGTKTETFNSNAADKQNEFDENASDKLAEYNQNAKELINKVEQVQAENETLKAENKLIKEQIPSASASGNSVHIEDSGTLDFDWKINGGHKQETRDGYNLLIPPASKTESGITFTINKDNSVTVNGTATANTSINFINKEGSPYMSFEAGTYRLTGCPNGGSSTTYRMGMNLSGDSFDTGDGATKTITTAVTNRSVWLIVYKGTTVNNLTFYPMLIKSTEDKPYEQYGVSPSSDYPSKIETVGSNVNLLENKATTQTINGVTFTVNKDGSVMANGTTTTSITFKINNDIVPKNISNLILSGCPNNGSNTTYDLKIELYKNNVWTKALYDFENGVDTGDLSEYTSCMISITIRKDYNANNLIFKPKLEKGTKATPYSPYGMGCVKIDVINKNLYNGKNEIGGINNDGSLNNNADRWRAIDYINVENSTDISINIYNITTTGALGKYCLYDKNYNFLSSTQIININTVVNVSNVSYFRFWFLNDKVPTNTKIQVETGSTPTTYAQHQSQTAIMPIQQEMLTGDYISSVEHHEWGKLVLTGNENFAQAQNANKLNYFYLNYNLIKIKGKIISNMLKSVKSGEIWNKTSYDDVVQVSDNKQTINIMLSDTTITTLQQFKEKLKELYNAGTPIIIYYELATPVNLELTVEQKSIRDTKLYTYKNITNIDISDELASIDVEYKKDQDTINKNYENRLAALEAASIS